jgi:hypothetical protein
MKTPNDVIKMMLDAAGMSSLEEAAQKQSPEVFKNMIEMAMRIFSVEVMDSFGAERFKKALADIMAIEVDHGVTQNQAYDAWRSGVTRCQDIAEGAIMNWAKRTTDEA